MKMQSVNKPDRPIVNLLVPIRGLIRMIRIFGYRVKLGKKFSYGKNVVFGKRCDLLPPNKLKIGNDVRVGSGFHLESDLEVGDQVLISSNVSVIGNDHRFDRTGCSIFHSGRLPPSSVIIEGDNLIGHRVIIIGNVRIGRGCIVGAGSVVTKDLPEDMICYGIPAKPMKSRFGTALQIENAGRIR